MASSNASIGRSTRDETRARILGKADALFRQFGSMKTTVSDIAGELGMSPANIYKFFASKDAIVEACASNELANLKSDMLRAANAKGSATTRLENVVLSIVRRQKAMFLNEKQIYRLILMAEEQNWVCLQHFRADLHQIAAGIIRSGIEAGEFGATDPVQAAAVLMDCLMSVTHPVLMMEIAETDVESRASAQVRFLARALR